MARVKSKFNIVAYDKAGQEVMLHQNIESAGLIALLKEEKQSIDDNYTKIHVERIADGLKISRPVGNNTEWVDRLAQTLKLGKTRIVNNTHSYVVSFAVYKIDRLDPAFHQDFPQSYVINSTQKFQDDVFSKIVDMQQKMRVAVLRVLDVATDIDDPKNEKYTPLCAVVFYPNMIVGMPDMKKTGVRLNYNDRRCVKLTINKKIRMKTGGMKSYFANQQDAVDAINNVVAEISKYNRRKFKTNGK